MRRSETPADSCSGSLLLLGSHLLELFFAHAGPGLLAGAFAGQLGAHELALLLCLGRHFVPPLVVIRPCLRALGHDGDTMAPGGANGSVQGTRLPATHGTSRRC